MAHQSLNEMLLGIGIVLHQLRHAKDDKLTHVARKIKVDHGTISRIEHGRYKSLGLRLLLLFADYYNTTVDQILLDARLQTDNNKQHRG